MASVLAAAQAWSGRHAINPDGISYLDIADAYLAGDFSNVVNGYWSPLYSWLLAGALGVARVGFRSELVVVHAVNFGLFLCSLVAFSLFVRELIRFRGKLPGESAMTAALPDWVLVALAYAIFTWSSLSLITLSVVTPDLCVAAVMYGVAALLLRIQSGGRRWRLFAVLGGILGMGYLAKAGVLPLAAGSLLASGLAMRDWRAAMPRVMVAASCFCVLAAPWVAVLSASKGRPTFGDSGKLNYAWAVNDVPIFANWQGGDPLDGTPLHPPSRLVEHPATFEQGDRVAGSLPLWYDPSFWYEGVTPHFSLHGQLEVLTDAAHVYDYILLRGPQALLVVGFALIWLRVRRVPRLRDLPSAVFLLPSAAALAMYALVHVQPRYVAAFVTVGWVALFSALATPRRRGQHALVAVGLAMALTLLGTQAVKTLDPRRPVASEWEGGGAEGHWRVATSLRAMGVRRGDEVAYVGDPFGPLRAYWARLADARITANVAEPDAFWTASPAVRSAVLRKLATSGAKLAVSDRRPPPGSGAGWRPLSRTGRYVLVLDPKA